MVILSVLLISGLCYAGHTHRPLAANSNVKMAIHLIAYDAGMGCSAKQGFPQISGTGDIVSRIDPGGYPYDVHVFPVVYGFVEITGVAFGLVWPAGWGSTVWTRCAGDQAIGDIVNPFDGQAFTYLTCKYPPGDVPSFLVMGYAWLAASAAGEIEVGANPSTNYINVTDCLFQETVIESVFHGGIGLEPYQGTPKYATEPTTWGEIKAMFK
jgi:hypothetical protein